MRFVRIPDTELTSSCICLGTAGIGSTIDQETSYQMMDRYLDVGGNFLDTAKVYADWLPGERSISEKTIGRWMKLRGTRSRVILASKGAHPNLETMHVPRMSRQEIISDLNASLSHLQTDWLDLYWLHRDDPQHPIEDILETLNLLVEQGKIRYFGCSNWRRNRIQAAQEYARRYGLQGFSAVQNLWSLATVNLEAIEDPSLVVMDDDLFQYHFLTGLTSIPFSSQANGYFKKKASGLTDEISSGSYKMYETPENEFRFQRIRQLSQQTGLTITQIQLGYLMSQPFTVIPIVGSRTIAQLEDSMSAGDVELTKEQIEFLLGQSKAS